VVTDTAQTLAGLRSSLGISQDKLGIAIGTSQPGVKKVEGAVDPRLSSLRRYIEGLGIAAGKVATLQLIATIGEESFMLQMPTDAGRHPEPQRTTDEPVWRLRAWDDVAIEQALLDRNLISISADELGDLSDRPRDEEVRARLRAAPALADRSDQAIGLFVSYWRMFRLQMQPGHLVVVPLSGRRVAIGEVVGDYRYVPDEPEPRLRHVRDVRWLSTIPRAALDEDVRRVVNAPGTICAVGAPQASARLRRLAG
jgi:transcriptional regulator with XRE-family HTH domain